VNVVAAVLMFRPISRIGTTSIIDVPHSSANAGHTWSATPSTPVAICPDEPVPRPHRGRPWRVLDPGDFPLFRGPPRLSNTIPCLPGVATSTTLENILVFKVTRKRR
jgi:hypothetical protein